MVVHLERAYLNLKVDDIVLVAVAGRWHSWDEPPSEAVAVVLVVDASLPSFPPADGGFVRRRFVLPSSLAWQIHSGDRIEVVGAASDAVAVASIIAAVVVLHCFASAAKHSPISSSQNPDQLSCRSH